jgi:integrase
MEQAMPRQDRRTLTDRFIKSLKPANPGDRDFYPDVLVPELDVCVTDKGAKSFGLTKRYPLRPQSPTRRSLGKPYFPNKGEPEPEIHNGALTLAQARSKGREWLDLIARGIDPRVEEARVRAEAQRRQINTFGFVGAEFLERHAGTLKKSAEAKRIIQGFIKRWGDRPATDITPLEVAAAIREFVRRGARYEAHNAFGWGRRLYTWAMGTQEFGIESSPFERLKPKDLIGAREARSRTLSDDELRAVWHAAGALGYPYGAAIQMLVLTGQRRREITGISWSEIDFTQCLLTIPGARMKGGRAHEVPLTPRAVALLSSLPRWVGPFAFTTTAGEKPINGFSKIKRRLDDLSGATGWVLHDIRRTVRTHLSALPVQDIVREAVIAHARPGLHKVYDLHEYQAEKRHCLEHWEKRLLAIVEPAPPNVADLGKARMERARYA